MECYGQLPMYGWQTLWLWFTHQKLQVSIATLSHQIAPNQPTGTVDSHECDGYASKPSAPKRYPSISRGLWMFTPQNMVKFPGNLSHAIPISRRKPGPRRRAWKANRWARRICKASSARRSVQQSPGPKGWPVDRWKNCCFWKVKTCENHGKHRAFRYFQYLSMICCLV